VVQHTMKTTALARNFMRNETRKRSLVARESLSGQEAAHLSAQVVAHLLQTFPQPPGKCVGFCWPIRNEPDIRPAIRHWLAMGITAALPVTPAEARALSFRLWQPESRLIPDRHGIPTPPADAPAVRPDVLLIPLNAFDAAGYRLGYGGGFFDRTLASLAEASARPLAIGIGFELGRVPDIAPQPHDQPMDWLVTEAGSWRIRE